MCRKKKERGRQRGGKGQNAHKVCACVAVMHCLFLPCAAVEDKHAQWEPRGRGSLLPYQRTHSCTLGLMCDRLSSLSVSLSFSVLPRKHWC